jgi:DNA-binding SARP family transcriptional activator
MYYLREAARLSRADFEHPEYQVRLASIYMTMGQPEIAFDTLNPALGLIEKSQHPSQLQSLGNFYMADALYRLGQTHEAQNSLQKSISAAAKLGYDHFLVNATRRSPGSIEAIVKTWPNKHSQTIIKRAKELKTGYQSLIARGAPKEEISEMTLQVRSLGSDEIRLDAEILPNSAWKSARAKALFYFILDQGKVKRDDIAFEFWPDFSKAKVNSNFHATLWRVRNALGSKHIISFDGESYSINPQVDLFYDVAEYEEILHMLEAPTLTIYERRNLSQQAIDMYQGDFLISVDMAWCDMRRTELRKANLDLLIQFAEIEVELQHFEEASELYEQAIALEPYQDQLHMALMDCLVKMKSPTAAKAHYRQYKRILKDELGIEPLEELQRFYDAL